MSVAVILTLLASLNLAGNGADQIASWIFQSLLLVDGGLIIDDQVFTVRYVETAFTKSADAELRGLDVSALVRAARAAFSGWFHPGVNTRLILTTVGSLLVILLLALS
ncbi:hypothetical protein ACFSKW_50345 [Nonomuraea mangrovi]|uniref:Uncharacterized protein n=1 Tax=Nonomuraea mangrovi TaxID=2316207 RepID=A0ABW4TG06_9ACTN